MVAETGTSSDNDREFLRQTKRGTCEFKFKVNFCTVSASGKPCIVSQSPPQDILRATHRTIMGVLADDKNRRTRTIECLAIAGGWRRGVKMPQQMAQGVCVCIGKIGS